MNKAKTVESYVESSKEWKEALFQLRECLKTTNLSEEIKWGMPVYTLKGKNVAGFCAFKSYVGIWFYQGVFLEDPGKKLISAQEGITKAMRQWRFTSAEEIKNERESILAYLDEAIQNQEEGKEIKPARNKPLVLPPELLAAFTNNPDLKNNFEALSLSKQRDFAEYLSGAKRQENRDQRLNKIIPMIQRGMGLNDKYKKPSR